MDEKIMDWIDSLKYDPIKSLLESKNEAIVFYTKRDLLGERIEQIHPLWEHRNAQKIIQKQQTDGSWKYPGKGKSPETNYNFLQTLKTIRQLIVKFDFNKSHSAITKAVEYILQFQTADGDIREMYGTQYSPNYTSIALENIIKAGYEIDPRIELYFQWIISLRQDDGGWAIPLRTAKISWQDAIEKSDPIMPIKSRPSSHWVTDLVLRAFAAHSKYKNSEIAKKAGVLLMSRFFKADKYVDRRIPEYWTKFTYPFWWGDLLSSLNSLSLMDFPRNEPLIKKALAWFVDRQRPNGLWREKLLMGGNDPELPTWMSLAICRVFKRFYTT